jgi:hypothetical protein
MTMTLATFLSCARKHWSGIAAMVVFLIVVVWAYTQGVSNGKADRVAYYEPILAERDRASAQALTDALASANAQAAEAMAAERQHLIAQAKTDDRFKVITKTVKEYINETTDLDRCGLDADGVRNWNTANRGSDPAPATNP